MLALTGISRVPPKVDAASAFGETTPAVVIAVVATCVLVLLVLNLLLIAVCLCQRGRRDSFSERARGQESGRSKESMKIICSFRELKFSFFYTSLGQ